MKRHFFKKDLLNRQYNNLILILSLVESQMENSCVGRVRIMFESLPHAETSQI